MARLWAHPSDLTLLNRVGVVMTGDDIDSDGDYFPDGLGCQPAAAGGETGLEGLRVCGVCCIRRGRPQCAIA